MEIRRSENTILKEIDRLQSLFMEQINMSARTSTVKEERYAIH